MSWMDSVDKATSVSTDVHVVALDDEGLEKKGVNALGARRKLLKVCRIVPVFD